MLKRALFPALLTGLTLIQAAFGTSFIERPFPESVKDAPIIVRGKAGTSYSDWARNDDQSRRIYTFTEIQVDEAIKGGFGNQRSVIVRELGGEKDGLGMQVPGTAKFQRGEDVVVFLGRRNEDGSYNVRGMSMGKYNVARDENGTEYLSGGSLALHSEHRVENGGQDDTRTEPKWTLDRLKKLVQEQTPPVVPAQETQNPKAIPSVNPVTEASDRPAPQLQSSTADTPAQSPSEEKSRTGLWVGIVIGALAIAWAFMKFARGKRP